jgi:hypothetical protein
MLILCILVAIPILLAGLAATAEVTGIGRHSVPMQLARSGVDIVLHGCDGCLPGQRPMPGLIPRPPQYVVNRELDGDVARRINTAGPQDTLRAAAFLCDPGDTVELLRMEDETAEGTVPTEAVCNDGKPLRGGD